MADEEEYTVVLGHGVGGKAKQTEDGYWSLPLICEVEGEMKKVEIIFPTEDATKEVEKYFKSPEGMEPLEFMF